MEFNLILDDSQILLIFTTIGQPISHPKYTNALNIVN